MSLKCLRNFMRKLHTSENSHQNLENNRIIIRNSFLRIAVEYGPWIPAPLRTNPTLGWDFDKELWKNSPSKKYSRMIWRQEYFWRKTTAEYLCRGFWATVRMLVYKSPLFLLFLIN